MFIIVYIGLCPIVIREYLPVQYTGIFGTVFYLMISLGTNIAFFFKFNWMVRYYYIVLWIPAFVLVVQVVFILCFFNVESPRFVFLKLSKQYAYISMDDSKEYLPNEETSASETLIEQPTQTKLQTKFTQDPQVRKHALCFYGEKRADDYIKYSFKELAQALLDTGRAQCIEDELGPLRLGLHPKYRKQFILCLLMNFLNQATGMNCLVMYSSNIFRQVGYAANAEMLTTIIGKINSRLQ